MSVMSRLFGPAPAAKQESMAINNPGANPANVTAQQNNTSANGAAVKTTPLDDFKDIWQPTKTDPNSDPFSKPLLTNDPVKLAEAVGRMNFTEGMDQTLAAKALQGDSAALAQVINAAAQKAFAASAQLSTQMIESSVNSNNARVNQTLPAKFKEYQVGTLKSDSVILNHEAAAPILDMAKRSIMSKEPHLSPSQVQAKAEQYVQNFGESLRQENASKATPTYDPYDFSNLG